MKMFSAHSFSIWDNIMSVSWSVVGCLSARAFVNSKQLVLAIICFTVSAFAGVFCGLVGDFVFSKEGK